MLKFDRRGFIFVEVVFVTLIVSFTAMMIVRSYKTAIQSSQISAIRTAAMYTANAQMSEVEYYVNTNKHLPPSFDLLESDFLTYEDFYGMSGKLNFIVSTQSDEMSVPTAKARKYHISVKVNWTFDDNDYDPDENYEEIEKDIWINTDD